MADRETTDMTLFVRTSREDITGWNRQKIVDALMRETNVNIDMAEAISKEVERQIASLKINMLTAPLIRELVNAKLVERGLKQAITQHTRLGFPLYDVGELMLYRNKENANIPHSPEGTNLTLAEGIKKEYAILNVFSEDVGYAHMVGDIHLHNLGYIDRPYCCYQSLEYIKKYGLSLPNSLAIAAPAKHAEVLLLHMVRFAAALQGNFAGAIGWDAVNLFFAPYLSALSDDEIKQIAQMLIYEFAQQAVGRGGQTIFTDIHLNWEVPQHFEAVPAIGPGGTYTGKPYGAYERDAQRFVWALFDVFLKGDASGRPFVFPRPFVHITDNFFQTSGHKSFLEHICNVAVSKGNTHFVFDRNNFVAIPECCRLKVNGDTFKEPWKMRYFSIQNVSLNLPKTAYKADGDDHKLLSLIDETIELAVKAHVQKRDFIERLLSYGEQGPLALLAMRHDATPYLKMSQASYLLGIVGLNELVQIHKGVQLHESEKARQFSLSIILHMKERADALSRHHNMKFILQQSPAESTAYRFARLDLKRFSPQAGYIIKGDIAKGELYYTNSTFMNISASLHPFDRIRYEGEIHPLIDGQTITHIWLGEQEPSPALLAEFVGKVFAKTTNQQIVFSPDFTTCQSCCDTFRGLLNRCPRCGSEEIEGITRITGYFSKVSSWNKGKIAELRDRNREQKNLV